MSTFGLKGIRAGLSKYEGLCMHVSVSLVIILECTYLSNALYPYQTAIQPELSWRICYEQWYHTCRYAG